MRLTPICDWTDPQNPTKKQITEGNISQHAGPDRAERDRQRRTLVFAIARHPLAARQDPWPFWSKDAAGALWGFTASQCAELPLIGSDRLSILPTGPFGQCMQWDLVHYRSIMPFRKRRGSHNLSNKYSVDIDYMRISPPITKNLEAIEFTRDEQGQDWVSFGVHVFSDLFQVHYRPEKLKLNARGSKTSVTTASAVVTRGKKQQRLAKQEE